MLLSRLRQTNCLNIYKCLGKPVASIYTGKGQPVASIYTGLGMPVVSIYTGLGKTSCLDLGLGKPIALKNVQASQLPQFTQA